MSRIFRVTVNTGPVGSFVYKDITVADSLTDTEIEELAREEKDDIVSWEYYELAESKNICYKTNEPCLHDCKGLCRESC